MEEGPRPGLVKHAGGDDIESVEGVPTERLAPTGLVAGFLEFELQGSIRVSAFLGTTDVLALQGHLPTPDREVKVGLAVLVGPHDIRDELTISQRDEDAMVKVPLRELPLDIGLYAESPPDGVEDVPGRCP